MMCWVICGAIYGTKKALQRSRERIGYKLILIIAKELKGIGQQSGVRGKDFLSGELMGRGGLRGGSILGSFS